eukprot:3526517-Pleurochrysis_carterae.AAC.2
MPTTRTCAPARNPFRAPLVCRAQSRSAHNSASLALSARSCFWHSPRGFAGRRACDAHLLLSGVSAQPGAGARALRAAAACGGVPTSARAVATARERRR